MKIPEKSSEKSTNSELSDYNLKEKVRKRKRNEEEKRVSMWEEMRIVRKRQKEAEEELARRNREMEEMLVREGKEMEEQMKKTYEMKITALINEKECKMKLMVDALSERHNSLTQKNQEELDNLKKKHKTEEAKMVTKILTKLDEEEEDEEEEERERVKEEKKENIYPPPPPPECPICYEPMVPPLRIYQCGDGHLICGACRPRLLVFYIFTFVYILHFMSCY